jgi:hypothetical protein
MITVVELKIKFFSPGFKIQISVANEVAPKIRGKCSSFSKYSKQLMLRKTTSPSTPIMD